MKNQPAQTGADKVVFDAYCFFFDCHINNNQFIAFFSTNPDSLLQDNLKTNVE